MNSSGKRFHWWSLLLIIPFIAVLWPPFYAFDKPEVWGIPFFYWYQFLWVAISALLTAFVYWTMQRK
jgi:hypothetical protein